MTTHPTEADFKKATFAIAPNFLPMMRDSYNKPPWGDRDGGRFSDAAMVTIGARIIPERPSIPEWGDIPEDVREAMLERGAHAKHEHGVTFKRHFVESILTAALTSEPARPAWLDAPAVLAWHKNDGRTERTGRPGVKRVWSPDYRQTETWSTPSLRNVHWSDLIDVTPLWPLYPEGRAPEVGQ